MNAYICKVSLLLGIVIGFAHNNMLAGTSQNEGLSLVFVSCDTNGKLLVRIQNKTSSKITIPADESSLGVNSMRVVVAEKASDDAPYMLRRILAYDIMGPGSDSMEAVPPMGYADRVINLSSWASKYYFNNTLGNAPSLLDDPMRTPAGILTSAKLPEELPKVASLHAGDVVVVIYKVPGQIRRVPAYAGMWTGVLVCHGVVEQAKPEGKADGGNANASSSPASGSGK